MRHIGITPRRAAGAWGLGSLAVLAAGIGIAVVSVSAATVVLTIGVVGLVLTPVVALLTGFVRLTSRQPKAKSTGALSLWTGFVALIDHPAAPEPHEAAATRTHDAGSEG